MNTEYAAGIFAGIFSALLVYLIIRKITRKEKLNNNDFDERQELVRGRAYKYGFFTLVILLTLVMAAFELGAGIPVTPGLAIFISLLISIDVYAIYSIMHDAYFGIGANRRRYSLFFLIIILINAVGGFPNIQEFLRSGHTVLDLGSSANITVAIAFLPVLAAMIAKNISDDKEDRNEESEA